MREHDNDGMKKFSYCGRGLQMRDLGVKEKLKQIKTDSHKDENLSSVEGESFYVWEPKIL